MNMSISDILGIIIVISIFLGLILFFYINHINLQEPPKKVVATAIIESLINYKDEYESTVNPNLYDTFCKANSSNSIELNNKCSSLPAATCKMTSCCALVNGTQCAAGGAGGPTFKTDLNGNPINIDYYYYMNKCYGDNCP